MTTKKATYYLTIDYQPEQEACTLLLQWNKREERINGTWVYPKEVINQYKSWKPAYESFYELQHSINLDQGGSIPFIPMGDPYQDVKKQEDELLNRFRKWFRTSKGQDIEHELKMALNRLSSEQAKAIEGRSQSVDIYLEYDIDTLPEEIQVLPWERWVAELTANGRNGSSKGGRIRLLRTPKRTVPTLPVSLAKSNTLVSRRLPKTRILVILADDPTVRTDEYWQQFRALKAIAHVERVTWDPQGNRKTVLDALLPKIEDDRGWDILFFAGHSGDLHPSGALQLTSERTSNVTVSMTDLWESLDKAQQHGLKVALFNSCRGFSIGGSCVNLGFQALVMRERLPQDLAVRFLEYFTQALLDPTASDGHDVYTAMLRACDELEVQDNRLEFPSSQLLPCFFSPLDQPSVRIRPRGWKPSLKQWLPKPWQGVATGAIVLMSYMYPTQDFLMNLRYLSQAIYRDITYQHLGDVSTPPVHIIEINQESINEARTTKAYSNLQSKKIDREYLSEIIDKLVELDIKTIGINYFLNTREDNQEKLDKSIREAVSKHKVRFILSVDIFNKIPVHDETASPNWSLRGDSNFIPWALIKPIKSQCEKACPFAYLSALTHYLTQVTSKNSDIPSLPPLSLEEKTTEDSLQDTLVSFLTENSEYFSNKAFSQKSFINSSRDYIIDFSLPPAQVYQITTSADFLKEDQRLEDINVNEQLFLIGSGGYSKISTQPLPLSIYYLNRGKIRDDEWLLFFEDITAVENHAYMAHHFLKNHLIATFSSIWTTGLAIVLGQMTTVYSSGKSANIKQKRIILMIIMGAGIISLQLYVSVKILVPWVLPSSLFLIYTIPIFKRLKNA